MLSSPEIKLLAARPPCERAEGPRQHTGTAWCAGPAGVREQGERTPGFPRNRRDLSLSLVSYVGLRSCRTRKLRAWLAASGPVRSEAARCTEGIAGRAQEHGETGRQESEGLVVCAGQRDGQEGSSPSGARMRGAVSEGGGNSSLAGERQVWRTLHGHEGESRIQPRGTCSHLS